MITIELDIDDATQFATVYLSGKPIATVQRRRVLDRTNPYPWQAFALNGTRIFAQTGTSVKSLRRRMQDFADGTGIFRDHPLSPANKEGRS